MTLQPFHLKNSLSSLTVVLLPFIMLSQTYPTQWVSKGVGGGGAVFSPKISPHNSNEVFLACDMSLMHRSTDFGQNWSIIPFQQLTSQRNSNVQFTSDPNKLYVLKLSSNATYYPVKSNDGGSTWTNANNPASLTAYQLFASPYATEQIVISDKNSIYFSNSEGSNSFTTVLNTAGTYGLHLAGVYFENASTIYVCSNANFIYSSDSGGIWNTVPGGVTGIPTSEAIVSFSGAKVGSQVVFFCTTIDAAALSAIGKVSPENCRDFENVYKLRLGESQWTSITGTLPTPASDKPYLIGLSPTDTSNVYLGGQALVSGGNLGAVFMSDNGGLTWTNQFLHLSNFNSNSNITTGWLGKPSAVNPNYKFKWNGVNYLDGLSVDPNNSSRLFICDGMGAYTSINKGSDWQQAYTDLNYDNSAGTLLLQTSSYKTSGLETTAAYWLTWLDNANIIASYNDILARRTSDGGNTWDYNITGLDSTRINDINMVLKNPSNGYLYAAAGEIPGSNGDYTDARVAMVPGRISYSTDSGVTWNTLKSFGHAVSSIAFHPTDPLKMYATVVDVLGGVGDVYVCQNINTSPNTWTRLTSPPRTEGRAIKIVVLQNEDLVAVYGPRDVSSNSTPTYNYSSSSGVFYSDDDGASWQDRSHTNMQKATANVEIDPNDTNQNTWLAFTGTEGNPNPGVYRSTSKGISGTWVNVYNQSAFSSTWHPVLNNELYLCTTRNGLIYATNTNSNSWSMTPLTAYPFRYPYRVFFSPYNSNEVWVANFGNGFRQGTASAPLPVEFVDFQAQKQSSGVLLSWQTASENGNDGFDVQRSQDAKNWNIIGHVEGNGTTSGFMSYQFFDGQPYHGFNYYRLKQMDLNGKFEYSPVRSVEWEPNDMGISIFPNPCNEFISIELPPKIQGQGTTVLFYSPDNRLALKKQLIGSEIERVDISALQPGMYAVSLPFLTNRPAFIFFKNNP